MCGIGSNALEGEHRAGKGNEMVVRSENTRLNFGGIMCVKGCLREGREKSTGWVESEQRCRMVKGKRRKRRRR